MTEPTTASGTLDTRGFAPRAAIVTGADSGIGKATAVALARVGLDVGITWFGDEAGAKDTAEQVRATGVRVAVAELDLRRPAGAAAVVDDLVTELGGVDIFVNNAGMGTSAPFLELGYEDWRQVMDVDLDGAFVCLQAAARHMVAAGHGGRIVAVTSIHEVLPLIGNAPYSAAKGGLGLLVKVMALELAGYGITVNSVAPGEIATPMTGQEDVDPATTARPGVPLGRPGDAAEIAALITFLASPAAGYVTGATYLADGGMSLTGPLAGVHVHDRAWAKQ